MKALAGADIADRGHHADGHQGQKNEGGDQFRLDAERAGVELPDFGSHASGTIACGTSHRPDLSRIVARPKFEG